MASCDMPCGFTCWRAAEKQIQFPEDLIPVRCSNVKCLKERSMHPFCYNNWEQCLLTAMKNSPISSHWTDHQRLQRLWSRKHMEHLSHLCQCPCGEGFLHKPSAKLSAYFRQLSSSGNSSISNSSAGGGNSASRKHGGSHRSSVSSTGSGLGTRQRTLSSSSHYSNSTIPSPGPFDDSGFFEMTTSYSSLSESPVTKQLQSKRIRHRSTPSNAPVTPVGQAENVNLPGGNIFHRRQDFSVFFKLPKEKQNAYFICTEDDGCNGNDEMKAYLLSRLTFYRANCIPCLICRRTMPIYDHFPLLDGTFFLSPICHDADASFLVNGAAAMNRKNEQTKYLHGLCIDCMHNDIIKCRCCGQFWSGYRLLIGGLYNFDVFNATPCCSWRVSCSDCGQEIRLSDTYNKGVAFSYFSEPLNCNNCHRRGHHAVKNLSGCFIIEPANALQLE